MNLFSAFVVWLILWWLTLFIILPIGIRGQAEENDIFEGSEPGAPQSVDMKRKFKQTTIVATIIWLCIVALILSGLVTWEQLGSVFRR